jgi:hypothetical protein
MISGGRLALALAALLAAGCSAANPRPVYQTTTTASEGTSTLVVAVERDADNAYVVRALAHELAFGLAQRGRGAVDLPTFVQEARLRGIDVPVAVATRLGGGVADPDTLAWLAAERVTLLVFLEVPVYEQVWAGNGKRTRVGLTARGQRIDGREETWRAFTTPEVEDEPGQGFQIATESALGALVRVISGEPEPAALPSSILPKLNVRW